MNFFGMRIEFDRLERTLDDSTFSDYRDDWMNLGWEKISDLFVIPQLRRSVSIDSVADQENYSFPYDYNGAEVFLYFKSSSTGSSRRLDPVSEDVLALMFEQRSGNKGAVTYYDWFENVGTGNGGTRAACVLVNDSATVLCANAVSGDADTWIRFDPFSDSSSVTQNPGDYGYLVTSVADGVSFTLDREYRGPDALLANPAVGRITPAEQQQFIVYGNPSSSVTDAFTLDYYAKPRRMFNDADVPEWAGLGLAIVYMGVSTAFDYLQHTDSAKVWFGRSVARITALKRRRAHSQTLITDLTIGSVSGRRTGARSVYL